jgi:twitching motility protein PilT
MELASVLKLAVDQQCSDVHITVGMPPMMRRNGEILPIDPSLPALSAEDTRRVIYSMLEPDQRARLEANWELDSSYEVAGLSRFRVNVLVTRAGLETVMRVIGATIPEPEALGITPAMLTLAGLPRGLVLVTGPTGCGKSTTLACLIDRANETRPEHILTIEDPIEFIYTPKRCVIRQRQVGLNTKSFPNALKAALREDPNIILVGEMRDYETIGLAVTAAETGHLCFGTLHTQDAASTVARIIDVFPPHQQAQIRVQVANSLRAVISQLLLPRLDGKGRVAVRELMIVTPAIANMIREGKPFLIYSAIDTGGQAGMISMDRSLADVIRRGLVDPEVALSKAHDPSVVRQLAGLPAGAPAGAPARAR